MGFKPTLYFQNLQSLSEVMSSILDVKTMKRRKEKGITLRANASKF
jgi:hypothetical protein